MRRTRPNPLPDSDIWQMSQSSFIQSKFPGATWDLIYEEPLYTDLKRYRREWDRAMKLAITHGLISEEKADELKFYGPGYPIKPLPPILYHVTSAASAVIKEGLRTRDDLGHQHGRGLGGGTSDTVSLTTNMNIAESIFDGMLEGRLMARGELTMDAMIEMARTGHGARAPWLKKWFGYYESGPRDWGGPIPYELQMLVEGVAVTKEPFEDEVRRKLSDEELVERLFQVYKAWATFRESAGGAIHPVFFLSDPNYLATIKPREIAIIEFKGLPGKMGFYVVGEHEYRIWDGDAVSPIRIVERGA